MNFTTDSRYIPAAKKRTTAVFAVVILLVSLLVFGAFDSFVAGKPQKVELVSVGDNLLHLELIDSAKKADGSYDFTPCYAPVKALIEQADIAIINQETILGGAAFPYSGFPRFNSPQEAGDALVETGFDVVLQATNHSLDKGYKAIQNTMNFWKEKHPEIVTLGLNESKKQQETITVVKKNGIRIAMLNYTSITNGIPLPEDKPYAVNWMKKREKTLKRHIKKAKKISDVVIVFPHWGAEYTHEPNAYQTKLTSFFADQGVDIVIGTHPHVIEPVEWIERKDGGKMLVYYSLGNFISHQRKAPRMLGGLAKITIEKIDNEIRITNAGLVPLVTHYEFMNEIAGNFRVYPLEKYPGELADKHGVLETDPTFSLAYLNETAAEVAGDFLQ